MNWMYHPTHRPVMQGTHYDWAILMNSTCSVSHLVFGEFRGESPQNGASAGASDDIGASKGGIPASIGGADAPSERLSQAQVPAPIDAHMVYIFQSMYMILDSMFYDDTNTEAAFS